MYPLVFALVGAAAVSAQTTSPFIPTNITSSCSTFLTTLNNDASLQSCVTPLMNATASFSPIAAANLSQSDINYTLATLCKSGTGCNDQTIRSWLSNFYSNCSVELTSTTGYNAQVRELYDILYVVNPLRAAVCSIDSSNQDFCVNEIVNANKNATANANKNATISTGNGTDANANATVRLTLNSFATDAQSAIELAANNFYVLVSVPLTSLSKRVSSLLETRQNAQLPQFAQVAYPNTTVFRNTNIPFLFLQPSMTSAQLCTPCTREILVSYIKWEVAYPYALGLSQSPILGGQSALWNGINATCGQTYINAITSQVGVNAASLNMSSSAEPRWTGSLTVGSVAFIAGAVALLS